MTKKTMRSHEKNEKSPIDRPLSLERPLPSPILTNTARQEIGRLTEEEDGPPPFRQVFEAADHRGLGTLPSLAFRRCLLEGLGLDLTEAECEALLEYLVRSIVGVFGNRAGARGGPF